MSDQYRNHWYYRHFYRGGHYDFPLAFLVTAILMFAGVFLVIAASAAFG